jgi:serine/threonine protein phosphatase 1
MLGWWNRGPALAEIAPERPFYAIGDVHGRYDLLAPLLRRTGSGDPVVLVGDYIDRGEQSAQVLRHLFDDAGLICLQGNHEAMLLRFLDDPVANGPLWFRNGGLQTLASFGIAAPDQAMAPEALQQAARHLSQGMGAGMIAWLRALPLVYRSGNVLAVHAGLDPRRPPEAQDTEALIWGHPDFLRRPRQDGYWVVHGHTIVDSPAVTAGRIAIDTGAYATGRLTAARIAAGQVTFLPH